MLFEVSYKVKHPWRSPFQVHLQAFLGGFSCCLAPASEGRNSAMEVFSGVLKTCKSESFSLQVCKFLIRNPIRDHFLEIFCKLKSTFKEMVKSLYLVALQNAYCKPKTLVKRGFTEISRRAFFRNIPCTCYNLGQNICRLFHVLAQFLFTSSQTELDYYHWKVNVRVTSRVAKQLKTIREFRENPWIWIW